MVADKIKTISQLFTLLLRICFPTTHGCWMSDTQAFISNITNCVISSKVHYILTILLLTMVIRDGHEYSST